MKRPTCCRISFAVTVMVAALMVWRCEPLALAWEGDDGGLDQWEVTLGRYAERLNNQMQLTEPPAPPPPLPPHYDSWLRVAECESNGNWSINTGNGYYGGLQFALTSWRAVGGTGYPHQHSMLEQMWRAERLLNLQGWGAWPVCGRRR